MTDSNEIHEISFHVRYAETDQMGVVHHTAYLVWFEEGRSSLMRARGSGYDDFEKAGFFLPVVECHARFTSAARYDQRVTVRTWIEELKSRSLTFAYQAVESDTEELLATGYTKHFCTDHDGMPRRFPPEWKRLIEGS